MEISLGSLMDVAFRPIFLAAANFTGFGLCLAAGVMTANPYIIGGSFGFFIAGASIGALTIADRWSMSFYEDEEEEEPQPVQERKMPQPNVKKVEVKPSGIPPGPTKIPTYIDI